MIISYPPIFINNYLQEKIREEFRSNLDPFPQDINIPFFPVGPATIEQLTETFPDGEGLFAVYDRMFKMRRKAFPHIKDEQLLYYFYKMSGDPELLIETTQMVQDLLDRGDESAQELNTWISKHPRLFVVSDDQKVYQPKNDTGSYLAPDPNNPKSKSFLPVFFHDIKIYQLEETRDIIDFGTARTYAGNKIIIDYCYHTVGEKRRADGKLTYNNTVIN